MSRRADEALERIALELHRIHRVLVRLVAELESQASTAVLSQGDVMSIPSGGSTPITLTFVDASGASQPPPPGNASGLVVSISADNALVTIDTPVASGDTYAATASAGDTDTDTPFNYIASVANEDGGELFDADGTTPFVQPAALASSVTAAVPPPAQATTAVLSEG